MFVAKGYGHDSGGGGGAGPAGNPSAKVSGTQPKAPTNQPSHDPRTAYHTDG